MNLGDELKNLTAKAIVNSQKTLREKATVLADSYLNYLEEDLKKRASEGKNSYTVIAKSKVNGGMSFEMFHEVCGLIAERVAELGGIQFYITGDSSFDFGTCYWGDNKDKDLALGGADAEL